MQGRGCEVDCTYCGYGAGVSATRLARSTSMVAGASVAAVCAPARRRGREESAVKIVSIQEARKFSLDEVQVRPLVETDDMSAELLCFEAGQQAEPRTFQRTVVYQVLEGEALVNAGGARERLGKGRLLYVDPGAEHRVENAGGGLLVVLAIRPA